MARVMVVGLKPRLEVTVRALHELGTVQVDRWTDANVPAARPLRSESAALVREELARLQARLEGVRAALGSPPFPSGPDALAESSNCEAELRRALDQVAPEVQALLARRESLHAEQTSLPRYRLTLGKLAPILPPRARDPDVLTIGVLVSRIHADVLEALADEVLRLTVGEAEFVREDLDPSTLAMLLLIPRRHGPEVESLLGKEDIVRLRLPPAFSDQTLEQAVHSVENRLEEIPLELAQVGRQLGALSDHWSPRLDAWGDCLRRRLEEAEVLARIAESETTFQIFGWVPADEFPKLEAVLAREVGPEVAVERLPIRPEDEAHVPVALENPAIVRPFTRLVTILAMPSYRGLDPSRLMALFLPAFFGMILGDVGYGGILLGASLWLRRRLSRASALRDLATVLALGSAWGIVFGVLYGEAFGTLGEAFGLHPIWLDRSDPAKVPSLMLFAIGVGVVHTLLGLILGVWCAVRSRSRHLLLERGGMLVGLIGLLGAASALAGIFPHGFVTPGLSLVIVGIVLLGASLGWVGVIAGPIEFLGLIGNVLSYLRLAAIGLASVYLARVANDLAGSLGSALVGVLVAVLIHALNLVMGAFSPGIHSLRLHYVEFFRKFYEGGGRPYQPFRLEASAQEARHFG